ncbi:transposase [Streptomyces sp. NBC_01381]|uniref:Tn3 family transposase n=1 Tax=Streptomyces sp. NBC_01381 TaxID=2903845 RepID=UPI002254BE63|nr:Tn3 family transposase [Streptomyces sp. NBC_01381]MCX4672367.1 transposase [Streptomyces sp. NBC_01381]
MENWNSANTVLHYGKDGALTGPDREHSETSMLALHLLQSALVHINTLLLQQVLSDLMESATPMTATGPTTSPSSSSGRPAPWGARSSTNSWHAARMSAPWCGPPATRAGSKTRASR